MAQQEAAAVAGEEVVEDETLTEELKFALQTLEQGYVCEPPIRESKSAQEAEAVSSPVTKYAKGEPVANDYEKLAQGLASYMGLVLPNSRTQAKPKSSRSSSSKTKA